MSGSPASAGARISVATGGDAEMLPWTISPGESGTRRFAVPLVVARPILKSAARSAELVVGFEPAGDGAAAPRIDAAELLRGVALLEVEEPARDGRWALSRGHPAVRLVDRTGMPWMRVTYRSAAAGKSPTVTYSFKVPPGCPESGSRVVDLLLGSEGAHPANPPPLPALLEPRLLASIAVSLGSPEIPVDVLVEACSSLAEPPCAVTPAIRMFLRE
jgi:hypothetical protein